MDAIDTTSANETERPIGIQIPPGTTLEDLERAAVEQALRDSQGNRTHAAKSLGISVRTLQRKLKAWHGANHTVDPPIANENRSAMHSERTQHVWSPAERGLSHSLIARPQVARA